MTKTAAQYAAEAAARNAQKNAEGRCPGCGQVFNGARGLRAHQTGKFQSMACRPAK